MTTNAQAALLAAATIESGRDGTADDVLTTAAGMRTWLDEQDRLASSGDAVGSASDEVGADADEAENAWRMAVEQIPLGDTRTIEDDTDRAYRIEYLRECLTDPCAIDDDERPACADELRAREADEAPRAAGTQ